MHLLYNHMYNVYTSRTLNVYIGCMSEYEYIAIDEVNVYIDCFIKCAI